MSEATPRPWKIIGRTSSYINIVGDERPADGLPTARPGEIACCNVCRVHVHAPADANAALIVRAVNSHDHLIKAISAALSIVDLWLPASVEKEHEIEAAALDHMHLMLRAALSLAKGDE